MKNARKSTGLRPAVEGKGAENFNRRSWRALGPKKRKTGLPAVSGGGDVVKTNQVNIVSAAMFGHFQQINHPQKAGCKGQLVCDVLNSDLLNGIHLNFAFFHLVALPHMYARALPDANAARDRSAFYSLPEALCEKHRYFTSFKTASALIAVGHPE